MSETSEIGADVIHSTGHEVVVTDRRGTLANYVDQEPRRAPAFSHGITRHHKPSYDDYTLSKMHIMQMLGDIHGDEGLILFGRQIAVAVFCRPSISAAGIYMPVKDIKEDWWQHKVCLLIATGPDAFGAVTGNETYLKARFGDREPPKVGDWVFMNASTGTQLMLCGEGHSRPQGIDHLGREYDLFEWDGWPVRILDDDSLIGRIGKPHQII